MFDKEKKELKGSNFKLTMRIHVRKYNWPIGYNMISQKYVYIA